MLVAWAAKTGQEFARATLQACDALLWPRDYGSDLLACMAFETGETFSPSVRNGAGSSGTGLIQFMDSTARGLGTTTADLAKMTAVDQMLYVVRYFSPWASHIHCLKDMYLAILMPKYIGHDDDVAMFTAPSLAYTQNKGLDANRDGKITAAEAVARVRALLVKGFQYGTVGEVA